MNNVVFSNADFEVLEGYINTYASIALTRDETYTLIYETRAIAARETSGRSFTLSSENQEIFRKLYLALTQSQAGSEVIQMKGFAARLKVTLGWLQILDKDGTSTYEDSVLGASSAATSTPDGSLSLSVYTIDGGPLPDVRSTLNERDSIVYFTNVPPDGRTAIELYHFSIGSGQQTATIGNVSVNWYTAPEESPEVLSENRGSNAGWD